MRSVFYLFPCKKKSHIATNIAPMYTNAYSLLISVKYNLRFEKMYRLVKVWYNNVSVVMIGSNCILIFVHTLVIISNSCLQKLRDLIYLSNKLFFVYNRPVNYRAILKSQFRTFLFKTCFLHILKVKLVTMVTLLL